MKLKPVRKLAAFGAALLIMFGCLSVGAFAAGVPNGNEAMHVTVKTDVASAYAGDFVTVSLNISNNYNATAMRFPVLFDSDVFEALQADLNVQKAGVMLTEVSGTLSGVVTTNPAVFPAGYSSDDYGAVLIQWVGAVEVGTFSCYNQPAGSDCITFRLKVKAGATGSASVFIPPESTLFYYQAMNNPSDSDTMYNMNSATCAMTFTPAQFTVLEAAPGIAAVAGSGAVIDDTRSFIYGIAEALASLDNFVEPIGGATLEVVKSSGTSCGTGTQVRVVFNAATVATYTVVLFGDLNGDANIDSSDADICVDYENFIINLDPVEDAHTLFAGDVNGDGNMDSADAGVIIDYSNFLVGINQSTGQPYIL